MRKMFMNQVCSIVLTICLMAGMWMECLPSVSMAEDAGKTNTYKELTFSDWGIENGSYIANVSNEIKTANLESLDGTAFTGIINFNGNSGGSHGLRIGENNGNWTSLQIYYRASDDTLILLDTTGGSNVYGIWLGEGWNSRDIKLRLTFAQDVANATWSIGVWIDDVFKKTYSFANMSLGTCLMINGSVTLKDVSTEQTLPSDYKVYTHKDFNVPYGTYTAFNGTAAASGSIKGITKFDKAILHFPAISFEGDVDLNFAGQGPWEGFKLRAVSKTGILQLSSGYGQFITSPVDITDKLSGVDVVGGSYDLKISILYTDDTTMEIGLWFNDVLYDNKYVTVDVSEKTKDKLGLYMGITSVTGGGTITLQNPDSQEVLPSEYTTYTHGDFGVPYGTYTAANGAAAASGSVKGIANFDKTILHFPKISFEGDVDLNFAGMSSWEGFKLRAVSKTGALQLGSGYSQFITSPVDLTDEVAGVDVVGGSYDLKISILYTDATTIKMGIWFNDVLYDNKYITVDVSEKTKDKLGLFIGVTSITGGGAIRLESVGGNPGGSDEPDKPKNPGIYTELTFSDWGIVDGEYIPAQSYNLKNKLTTLNGVAFNGTFDYSKKNTYMRIGSKDGWQGILIAGRNGGLMADCEIQGFSSQDIMIGYTTKNLATEAFKLRLTFDLEDRNVWMGVWIDDEFQRYITYKGMADSMGTKILFDASGLIVGDVKIGAGEEDEKPTGSLKVPKDFQEVTFKSFGIKNGSYRYNDKNLSAMGESMFSLDRTVFSGDFYIPSGHYVDFRYGGVSNNWFGLVFSPTADGKIYMQGVASEGYVTDIYIFNPQKAKTALQDTWFNLKLSTEILDSDKDGKKDDVKVGIWFNGVLYNEKYIYLQDYAQYLGTRMGVYVGSKDGFLRLKSDTSVYVGIDFSLFGFSRNWDKELDDSE